jgi:CYTH domain-containing protein
MTVEVERKFLVRDLPDAAVLGPGEPLRQGYLAEEGDVSVRVRITAAAATLTVKAGGGLARTEVEFAISREQADALWPHTAGRRIDKRRHRVPLDGTGPLVAEVDLYAGPLDGLATVEVEFPDRETAESFVPPDWFGEELTGDHRWSNAALARAGRP